MYDADEAGPLLAGQAEISAEAGSRTPPNFTAVHVESTDSDEYAFPLPYPAAAPDVELGADSGSDIGEERQMPRHGAFKGVVIPTCEFMWSVLIFLMFGTIVGHAGLLCTWFAIFVSASIAALTVTSASAVATNKSRPPKGGMYEILSGSLGSGVGGGISIMYYLGVATLTSIEVVGSVQGLLLITTLKVTPYGRYADQVLLSTVTLLSSALPVLIGKRLVSVLAVVCMGYLLAAFASMFLGLLAASHAGGEVTGTRTATLLENLYPKFAEGAGSHGIYGFKDILVLIFPCFVGIYTGINLARNLKKPFEAIPRGGLYAVSLSLALYLALTGLIAASIRWPLLQNDTTIVLSIAWPFPSVPRIGVFVVGVGAAIHCLSSASTVLANLAAEGVCVPWIQRFLVSNRNQNFGVGAQRNASKSKVDPSSRALLFTVLLVLPLVLLPDLEILARVVSLAFLLCYTLTNLACYLLSSFSRHNWRPAFRFRYQSTTSLFGTWLCMIVMLYVSWIATVLSLCVLAMIAYSVQIHAENRTYGHGVHGLLLHLALLHLRFTEKEMYQKAVEVAALAAKPPRAPSLAQLSRASATGAQLLAMPPADMIYTRIWRPQVLALITVKGTKRWRAKCASSKTPGGRGASAAPQEMDIPELGILGLGAGLGDHVAGVTPSAAPPNIPGSSSAMNVDLHAPAYPRLLSFVSQLTTRSGLCIVASVVTHLEEEMGEVVVRDRYINEKNSPQLPKSLAGYEMQAARDEVLSRRRIALWNAMEEEEVEGFLKVFSAPSVGLGHSTLMQTVGLGELTPNTVIRHWPKADACESRNKNGKRKKASMSRSALRELQMFWSMTRRAGWSSCLCKGLGQFPGANERLTSNIDVWWVVPDGQLLLLIAAILRSHRVWRDCSVRLFMVARMSEDPESIRRSLVHHLELLRLRVTLVTVVQLPLYTPASLAPGDGEVPSSEIPDPEYALSREFSYEVTQSKPRPAFPSPSDASLRSPLFQTRKRAPSANEGAFPTDGSPIEQRRASPANAAAGGASFPGEMPGQFGKGQIAGNSSGDFQKPGGSGRVKFAMPSMPEAREGPTPRRRKATPAARTRASFEHAKMIAALKAEIRHHSSDSALVLLNLPPPDLDRQVMHSAAAEHRAAVYVDLVETLTANIPRTVLVHAGERAKLALSLANL